MTASPEEIRQLQQRVIAAPECSWTLDLETLDLSSAEASQPVLLAEGPRQMLTSGRWDATSQLISRDAELTALHDRLPYLNGFRVAT